MNINRQLSIEQKNIETKKGGESALSRMTVVWFGALVKMIPAMDDSDRFVIKTHSFIGVVWGTKKSTKCNQKYNEKWVKIPWRQAGRHWGAIVLCGEGGKQGGREEQWEACEGHRCDTPRRSLVASRRRYLLPLIPDPNNQPKILGDYESSPHPNMSDHPVPPPSKGIVFLSPSPCAWYCILSCTH